MEIIAAIIIAHLVGDYLLQSHWMATEKTSRWLPAIVHGVTYTLPFLFITQSPLALFVIASTHVLIDRYRLAKYLVWLKNQIAPKSFRYPWRVKPEEPAKLVVPPQEAIDAGKITTGFIQAENIKTFDGGPVFVAPKGTQMFVRDQSKDNDPTTGFPKATPAWLSVWLLIIADNTAHLLINIGAVLWL